MLIRPFTKEDYPTLARIDNAAFPEYPSSAEELEFEDTHRPEHCRQARWIMEEDGEPVGVGSYGQSAGSYHPRKFFLSITVLPERQGQGFGKALYNQVMQALEPFDLLSLRAQVRQDMTRGLRFLQERGFVEDMRDWESRLDLAAFDPKPYAEAEAGLTAQGIVIKTLRELENTPGHWDKHYQLTRELIADVPSSEPRTPIAKEVWQKRLQENPDLQRDAYLFAVQNGEYIGLTVLYSSQGNDDLYTGLTGVRREYRRQGIALALKLRALAWAKAQGRALVKTWNEENNRAMLGINERLGFVKQPAWLDMVKVWKEET